MNSKGIRLAIIGLGYVGLPLAVAFGKKRDVVGFDINSKRITSLKANYDHTHEIEPDELSSATFLEYSCDPERLRQCNCFIVAVPTPIDQHKQPDLRNLIGASGTVGAFIKPGDTVIYESTVYPGATEEKCVPELERKSGLKFNVDFFVGYSPERINPGDKSRRLTDIIKITSGSTDKTALFVDSLYKEIVTAGTHKAPSIRVAEAAKVIENTQRDLNIALINELAIIFKRLGIDTESVLLAAGTKWNFLPFRPGLVGGHCIGVDPYYLTHKAESTGYNPQIILAGRRLNDSMGEYIVSDLIKAMIRSGAQIRGSRILIMGLAFKENCSDLRNTRVVDVMNELQSYQCLVDIFDPQVSAEEAKEEYDIELIQYPDKELYDAIIVAVGHTAFADLGVDVIRTFGREKHVLYDVKHVFPTSETDLRL